jgi:protein-L-isoaspartate(D-aspartate) O-methyltransferase
MTLDENRRFYADEIRLASNLHSTVLVNAFAAVHREDYMGPPPWQVFSADQAALTALGLASTPITTSEPADLYHNVLVSLVPERNLNNGHPSTLAHWINALDLQPGDRVYHAGCGVGYYTAILAEVVGPQGSVIAIDVDPDLSARARHNLSGYAHVTVETGDGAAFDPGICDAMLINAGVTHPAPGWLARLKENGRLVLPFTGKTASNSGSGIMAKLTRTGHGIAAAIVSYVAIFSFTSLRDPELEPLLSNALMKRDLFKLQSLRLDEHAPSDTCLVHTKHMCLSSASLAA